jgi:hypothetical protein
MNAIPKLSLLVALFTGVHASAAPEEPPAAAPAPVQEDVNAKPAMAAAEAWLALVDARRTKESWESAAQLFREAVTPEQWGAAVRAARDPLGALVARKMVSASYTRSLPGAPAGEYVVIQYQARFENHPVGVETVTPMKDRDGVWRVSGYYVR